MSRGPARSYGKRVGDDRGVGCANREARHDRAAPRDVDLLRAVHGASAGPQCALRGRLGGSAVQLEREAVGAGAFVAVYTQPPVGGGVGWIYEPRKPQRLAELGEGASDLRSLKDLRGPTISATGFRTPTTWSSCMRSRA